MLARGVKYDDPKAPLLQSINRARWLSGQVLQFFRATGVTHKWRPAEHAPPMQAHAFAKTTTMTPDGYSLSLAEIERRGL
jgi:hypothetical protein